MIYRPRSRETDLCGDNDQTTKEEIQMAKLTFETDLCKGCGLCVNACPKGCLTIASDKINKKGYSPAVMADEEKCIGCAFCATMCPDCIITVEK